jgi:hypothetical protein
VAIGGARPYRAVCAWAVCVSAAAARRPRNCRPQPPSASPHVCYGRDDIKYKHRW